MCWQVAFHHQQLLKHIKLSIKSQAGELAGVLIERVKTPADLKVARILQTLKTSFDNFKVDKEVRNMMTREEMSKARGGDKKEAELLPVITNKLEK